MINAATLGRQLQLHFCGEAKGSAYIADGSIQII
jgi:hypothetical protein